MCKIMEDMVKEERAEERAETAKRMLKAGKYILEEIAGISGLSLDEVKKLQADQDA